MITNQCSDVPRQWSNLPRDILSHVADRLGLIDFLKFRPVCKDFLSASSTATAKTQCLPWFLVYGQSSRCCLVSYGDNCTKTYTLNLPQLEGATCLASTQGWLLVFREGSMFFYCPFSNVKIDLPNFPYAELKGNYYTAAFSAPPWSKDYVIAVITRTDENYLELNAVKYGDNWVTHNIKCEKKHFHNPKGAAYHGDTFYFLDKYCRHGITYCPKMKNLVTTYIYGIHVEIVFSPDGHIETGFLHNPPERQGLGTEVCLGHCRSFVRPMGVKKLIMGLEDASISTCGILMQFNHIPTVIYNENVRGNSGRRFKVRSAIFPRPILRPRDERLQAGSRTRLCRFNHPKKIKRDGVVFNNDGFPQHLVGVYCIN